jgi:hypothetical protein
MTFFFVVFSWKIEDVISLGRDTVSWFFECLVILMLGGQSMPVDLHSVYVFISWIVM